MGEGRPHQSRVEPLHPMKWPHPLWQLEINSIIISLYLGSETESSHAGLRMTSTVTPEEKDTRGDLEGFSPFL